MALWQFQVDFLPRAWHAAVAGDLSPLFSSDDRDTAQAWHDHQPSAPLEELFSSLLPRVPSRYAGELYWGDEKRTDAHIWYGNGLVEAIGVRVDARNYSAHMLVRIAEIAQSLDCLLLIPEARTVIEPNVFALSAALRASRAARYAKGPPRYLDDRPDDDPDDGPDQA